jgi:isocitrate dehydrogenase
MSVVGGNSIANVTSFTPGGVGVNQAFNVASLNSVTDATTATAYSVAQQLITTAWNQIFALAMLVWVFGWSGGKALVGESYADAKQKAAERKQSKEKKAEEPA